MPLLLLTIGCTTPPDPPPEATHAVPNGGEAHVVPAQARAQVPPEAPKPVVTACPAGVIAAPGWPGEYPHPVVEVRSAVQVDGYSHPCAEAAQESCTLEPGLYHPWARNPQHVFVTVRAVEEYVARAPFQLGPHSLDVGATVRLTQSIGEGFCAYEFGDDSFQAECPPRHKAHLEAKPTVERVTTQFMRVPCAGDEGATSWIAVDEALMEMDGVRKGQIVEYGSVGPGDD